MTTTQPATAAAALKPRREFWYEPRVEEATGLSRSTRYSLIRAGKFPAPVKVSPRRVAWISTEIEAWMDQRIAASRHALAPAEVTPHG